MAGACTFFSNCRPGTEAIPGLAAWDALARGVAERERLGRLVDEVVDVHRGRVAGEEPARRRAMLEALADALHCSMDYLVGRTDEYRRPPRPRAAMNRPPRCWPR